MIASCKSEGGNIALDGRGVSVPGYPDGNFVGATILEADTTMECYQYVPHSFAKTSSLMKELRIGKRSLDPSSSSSRPRTSTTPSRSSTLTDVRLPPPPMDSH